MTMNTMLGAHVFSGPHRLRGLVGVSLAAILIALAGCAVLPWDQMFPDVICYWTAGKILASGQSPYDAALQTQIQHQYGWDKAARGFGLFDYLPYYYPPWFGLTWVFLVPLGYPAAKTVWFFLNVQFAMIAGYLLGRSVPAVGRRISVVMTVVFLFSLACLVLGQTAMVVLLLVVLLWRLLEQGKDRCAGVTLAWMTIKPQLTAVLILGVLLWAVRQRRWGTVYLFFFTLALLCLVSTLIVPSWLTDMWNAIRHTSSPTDYYPWVGNSWLLVLKTLALPSPIVWVLYLGGALLFMGAVLRVAAFGEPANRRKGESGTGKLTIADSPFRPFAFSQHCTHPLPEVLGLGILAAFFVAPYARHYDFPLLLIPTMILLGRAGVASRAALAMALILIPYLQLHFLTSWKTADDFAPQFLAESTFFWVPLLLAIMWFVSRQRQASGPDCQSVPPSPSLNNGT